MSNPSDRNIAITFLEAYYAADTEDMKTVMEVLSTEILIKELSAISITLAAALGLFPDRGNPDTALQVLKRLRQITLEEELNSLN